MKIVPKPLLKHWGFSLYWMHYNALKMVVLILMIFETVGSRWCIQDEALNLLADLSLSHVSLATAMQQLSGGEQMRIRIAAAFLSQAQIFDFWMSQVIIWIITINKFYGR
nr:hypothetical protein [Escherichia coli]